MFHLFLLLMIVLGLGGLIFDFLKKSRRRKTLNLLHSERSLLNNIENNNAISHVEVLLKKSSRMISLATLLDKNIMLKISSIALFCGGVLFSDISGLFPMTMNTIALCFLFITVIVIVLPDIVKKTLIKKRIKNISNDLPFIIDMMAVCIQSGMTVEKSMRYISDNAKYINEDIAGLLERVMLKTDVSGINAALEQLYQEIVSNEVRMFCTTLQQSIKFGASIYQMLISLSKEMRDIQLLDMEEKVASLSAKMTMPMIGFIMFPLLAIIAGPGLIGMMSLWGN